MDDFFFFFDVDEDHLGDDTLSKYSENTFESIKHIDENGNEYWFARELRKVLDYSEFNKFEPVIKKAILACEKSGLLVSDHFAEVSEMVGIGSGAKRKFDSFKLSRYACYLIVQNADPTKEVIALGQTYFAVKTRQQELIDNYDSLSEEQKRLSIRSQMIEHNKSLVEAAHNAGIINSVDYAVFQNKGYQGLYGGLGAKQIHEKKGLKKSQGILDYMGSEELAANLFRATQTDAKLRRENIKGKNNANDVHFEVGKEVRKTIKSLGGTMPENLPTPDESIKQLEKKHHKLLDEDK